MKKYYTFPALLFFRGNGAVVEFPDFPGISHSTQNSEEVLEAAREVLALHLYKLEMDGGSIPEPSAVHELDAPPGAVVALVEAFMPSVRDRMKSRYVKKTLSVPAWLNEEAEAKGVNFSAVLQDGLKRYLEREED